MFTVLQFAAPGRGGTIGEPKRFSVLAVYRLQAGSPAIDAALDPQKLFGIDLGASDFNGLPATARHGNRRR